jgi:hypothetical protein
MQVTSAEYLQFQFSVLFAAAIPTGSVFLLLRDINEKRNTGRDVIQLCE